MVSTSYGFSILMFAYGRTEVNMLSLFTVHENFIFLWMRWLNALWWYKSICLSCDIFRWAFGIFRKSPFSCSLKDKWRLKSLYCTSVLGLICDSLKKHYSSCYWKGINWWFLSLWWFIYELIILWMLWLNADIGNLRITCYFWSSVLMTNIQIYIVVWWTWWCL